MGGISSFSILPGTVLKSHRVPDVEVVRQVAPWQARKLRRLRDITERGVHTNLQILQAKANGDEFPGFGFKTSKWKNKYN